MPCRGEDRSRSRSQTQRSIFGEASASALQEDGLRLGGGKGRGGGRRLDAYVASQPLAFTNSSQCNPKLQLSLSAILCSRCATCPGQHWEKPDWQPDLLAECLTSV